MHVDKREKRVMQITVVVLGVAIGALVLSMTASHKSLPEPAGRIRPEDVRVTAPFDNPGVRQVGENEYEVVMIAQAWEWVPNRVEIPAGSHVTFKVTSVDVIHGFRVPDTDLNAMVIPGQITEVDVDFDEARDFTLLCHEYCGIGHHRMGADIVIVEN